MDFRLVFEPITKPKLHNSTSAKLIESVYVNEEEFPDWRKGKIAIFSVGLEGNNFAAPIREEFYALYSGYSSEKIVDLGVLKPGVNRDETLLRVKEICTELMLADTIPFILGSHHSLDYGQYMGYEELEKDVNLLVVDSKIDLMDGEDLEAHHTKQLVLHSPNYMFNYSHLGHQFYLNAPEVMETLEKLNFDSIRLGNLKNNIADNEPYIRYANMLSFDLSVIKHADAPGKKDSQPFGLGSEDACQIAWYAGISNKLQSAGIYGYNRFLDDRNMTAKVVAVMMWYFIEGVSEREELHEFESEFYKKYIVSFDAYQDVVFYKSRIKEFWWMKIVDNIYPCSYSDYEKASNGILPEIYANFVNKQL